jgi:sulfur relay (sulfurtransferase) complex TusBCD TusD component (DsrE family)
MSSIVIVIQSKPYIDNKAWDAIRFAGASLVEDMDVRIHLLGEGVEIARKGHQALNNHANLEDLISEFIECGINVSACGKSLDDLKITESDMIADIEKGSMKALASWVNNSNHSMIF